MLNNIEDVMVDAVFDGRSSGGLAATLLQNNFNPRYLRPFEHGGRSYVSINNSEGGIETKLANTEALLRRDEWKYFDDVILKASRERLRAWDELRAASSLVIPNGLGITQFNTQTANDPGSAQISMDGDVQDPNFRQVFDSTTLPLPIVSAGFSIGVRELAASRNSGGGALDVSQAESAARRVAETIEDLTIGVTTWAGMGGNIYGYGNFPQRATVTVVAPTDVGWTPQDFVDTLLEMREDMMDMKRGGPWVVYVGRGWDRYLDTDFKANGSATLRQRAGQIDGISRITTLRQLTGFRILMVQLTSDNCRAVIGMDPVTVQWESPGAMRRHFRVMGIMVPQMRAEFSGDCGIVDANV